MVRRNWSRDPFLPWREEMARFFTNQFSDAAREAGSSDAEPAVNLWENETELRAEVELPGVHQDDLEVLVVGGELTIKGQRGPVATGEQTYHRRERMVGAFERTIRLPIDVDAAKVQATRRDGVLEITLPKAEAAKPRKIPVQTAS